MQYFMFIAGIYRMKGVKASKVENSKRKEKEKKMEKNREYGAHHTKWACGARHLDVWHPPHDLKGVVAPATKQGNGDAHPSKGGARRRDQTRVVATATTRSSLLSLHNFSHDSITFSLQSKEVKNI